MEAAANPEYKLFDDPLHYFNAMLNDIENAKEYIYLEMYRMGNDSIGQKFKEALTKKAREGLEVKLLLDSWGTSLPHSFFKEFESYGGSVTFFKKIRFYFDFFTKNHRRNHRKLLIIDDKISYIGSGNLTAYSIIWRELMLRIEEEELTRIFKRTFLESHQIYNKYIFNRFAGRKTIFYRDFSIIRDLPSIYRQSIKKKYEELISNAKSEVVIETPYFLPGFKLRKAMMEAASRGVNVSVIVPEHSDVKVADLLRCKYLGILHKNNVNIQFYKPHNLHAKCMMVDKQIFAIGTSNFDYRSFRYQHEIMLCGKEDSIVGELTSHIAQSLNDSVAFDYKKWLGRPRTQKFFEYILIPFRHLL
ncbi:MAG: phosphatidylserine/phosphatidylglycerophosphate/cardiolipin synthase family protein [Bacteroidales bacterium]|nr:phosphatidylserine/phosphatidylglycerophosphate/cardiolipin synthase family protein [Bacteroidales bacterium]